MVRQKRKSVPLGQTVTLWVLLVSGVFTLVASGVQLYLDFRVDVRDIDKTLDIIETSYIGSLKNDIWNMVNSNIETRMQEILNLPHVVHVDLHTDNMAPITIGQLPEPELQVKRAYSLNYFYHNEEHEIGTLTLTSSLEATYQTLLDKAIVILISQAIKTFFISFFILYLIYSLITKHLKTISEYITQIDIDTETAPVPLGRKRSHFNFGRKDELDLLIKTINTMKTDLHENMSELKEARNYIVNIINSMPSILISIDIDGKVTEWNDKAQKLTGLTANQARGQQLPEVFPRLSVEMNQIQKAIKTRRNITVSKHPYETDANIHYEDITIYPLSTNGAVGAVIRVDDVTDQVRLEEMMVQSEKMLSMGGLAAGMAHEINNPLAGMMQTAQVLHDRLTSKDMQANIMAAKAAGITIEQIDGYMKARGILRMAESINHSGRRIAAIVGNMLSFARQSDTVISAHDLGELMDSTLELAATDYDMKKQYDFKMINVAREYAEDVPAVNCEGTKIQQVLLNILRNGAQAMQSAHIEEPKFTLRLKDLSEQGMVCIEIEDNGPGIEPAIRKRIFEPFFTTKPVGSGTGLGLSVSYFIITENHGGKMSVTSQQGDGTRFDIYLPLTQPDTAKPKQMGPH